MVGENLGLAYTSRFCLSPLIESCGAHCLIESLFIVFIMIIRETLMLSQAVDYNFIFSSTVLFFLELMVIFICYFSLLVWQIYSKCTNGFLPPLTILFHMVRCVCVSHCPLELFFPPGQCEMCHMLVTGLLFLGLSLQLSRIAFQVLGIFEKMGTTFLAMVCV